MSDIKVSTQQLLSIIGRKQVEIEVLEAQNAEMQAAIERLKDEVKPSRKKDSSDEVQEESK